jgi:hypothetical protein
MGKLSALLTMMQYTSFKTRRANCSYSQFHLLSLCTATARSSNIFTICLMTPCLTEQMIYTHGTDMARRGPAYNFTLPNSCSQKGLQEQMHLCQCGILIYICELAYLWTHLHLVYSFTSVNLRTWWAGCRQLAAGSCVWLALWLAVASSGWPWLAVAGWLWLSVV